MNRAWERVRQVVQCAYGCQITHPDWAWFGRHPFVVCESCAAKYGIFREPIAASVPGELEPATAEPHAFTPMRAIAETFAQTPGKVVRAVQTRVRRTR